MHSPNKPGTCASSINAFGHWQFVEYLLGAEHGCHLREHEDVSIYKEFTMY